MTSPNWNLLQNNALQHLGYGLQLGQQMTDRREQREDRNALLQFRERQEERLSRQEQAQTQQAQETDRRNDLPVMARLLQSAQDEPTYQQMIGMAQRYGIDTADAPPNFDPQWVQSTLTLAQAAQTPQGQEALSSAGKQAQDAGFRPGTPEFNQAVRQIVTADLAQPYTGSQGETRLYQPEVFGGQQFAPPAGNPVVQSAADLLDAQAYQGAVNSLGPAGAARLLQARGGVVRVTTPQEAAQLPSGTRILLPDGTPGVVP